MLENNCLFQQNCEKSVWREQKRGAGHEEHNQLLPEGPARRHGRRLTYTCTYIMK